MDRNTARVEFDGHLRSGERVGDRGLHGSRATRAAHAGYLKRSNHGPPHLSR
jgi:hypothetical protein